MKNKRSTASNKGSKYIPARKTDGGAPDSVLRYLTESKNRKTPLKKLLKAFGKRFEAKEIVQALAQLVTEKKIEIDSKEQIKLVAASVAGSSAVHIGRLDVLRSGAGFVYVEALGEEVFIPQKYIGKAFHSDMVSVALQSGKGGRGLEGKVIDVVKRERTTFAGEIKTLKDISFFIADHQKMKVDFFIPPDKLNGAKDGDKVIVEMLDWPEKAKSPYGRVVEVLGKPGSTDIETKSILIEHGFNIAFPQNVLNEAESISERIPDKEVKKRLDYRDILTMTIDPDDAKDFDDALSFRKLANGFIEVGVHIADVSHYVKPDSALDKEAYFRSTSVYLPDRVCPMLPENISNNICSLRPHVDRLCFASIFTFDTKFQIKEFAFAKTIIHSDRRFTYNEVQQIIETKAGDYSDEVLQLNEIAHKLRKDRFEQGSVNFDAPEVRFRLDDKGLPIDVFVKERKDAHLLIEDFMLLANKTVARYVSKLRPNQQVIPFAYRIHDKPAADKLENFAQVAKRFGYQLKFNSMSDVPHVLNNLLKKIAGRPEQSVLESMAIRSMAKAVYTTKNIGHYGLGFEHYCHFTSPIRRYPDVMVHRTLEQCLADNFRFQPIEEVEEQCKHVSLMERNAVMAEREAVKYMQCIYMRDRVGQQFDGMISGMLSKGIFVELDQNHCEGFISAEGLGVGDFSFDEQNMWLQNLRTGERYKFGDRLRVLVDSVHLKDKRIEFKFIERIG